MSDEKSATNGDSLAGFDPTESVKSGDVSYSVVLESIKSDIETFESFALKFAIITRVPITKVKYITRKLPATVWTSRQKSQAQKLLRLIEEAGGNGTIVEAHSPAGEAVAAPAAQSPLSLMCERCGFPLKEGDKYCSFCMTPVEVQEKQADKTPPRPAFVRKPPAVPTYRLLFYVIILIAGILISLALR